MARRRLKDYIRDIGITIGAIAVGVVGGNALHNDHAKFVDGKVKLEKFKADTGEKYAEWEGHNMILNTGGTELLKLATGASSSHLDITNAQIGVGDNSVTSTAGMTGLQAVTNTLYVGMDAGYPTTPLANCVSWRSTYSTGSANYAWKEIVLKQSGSGIAFSRLINSTTGWGTKTSSEIWTLTYQYCVGN